MKANEKTAGRARRSRAARALKQLRRALREEKCTAAERIRVARAYRVLGDAARAATWYRSAVDELSMRGQALQALAIAKEMTEIVPQEQRVFASLAMRFSKRPGDGAAGTPAAAPSAAPAAAAATHTGPRPGEPVLDAEELLKVHEAETLGVAEWVSGESDLPSLVPPDVLDDLHRRGEIDLFDSQGRLLERPAGPTELVEMEEDHGEPSLKKRRLVDPEEAARSLAAVPLFSELDQSAFHELARTTLLRAVRDHGYVFREGERADSFFIVAEGRLECLKMSGKRPLVLRQFEQGEVFGVFGVFAGRTRAASVRALGNATVLEISADALVRVARGHPAARAALLRFYRERLLETFLATSPVFDELDGDGRTALIAQFKERRLAVGEKVVSPGEVFNGIYVLVSGRLEVNTRKGATDDDALISIARGQYCAVVNALIGTPCRCAVSVADDTTLIHLSQKAFNDFVREHPALRRLPARLAEEAKAVDRGIYVGDMGIPGLT